MKAPTPRKPDVKSRPYTILSGNSDRRLKVWSRAGLEGSAAARRRLKDQVANKGGGFHSPG